MSLLLAFMAGFAETLLRVLPYLVAMGIGFALLSWWSPGNGGRPWWKKHGLATDICYWLVVPILQRYGRIGITVAITVYVLGINTADGITKFFDHGHGPISHLPFWAQVVLYLVFTEFCLYWIHRAFHGTKLWQFHAVHHASQDLEWISAARFHPVNILLGVVAADVAALLAGVTPYVFLVTGPFATITSAFVHANLNWTLGPFKYVMAGPVFHRWHHTVEHGNCNYASTFPVFDLMFGTFYMPEGALPENFGIGEEVVPESFGRQLVHPLLA
ncbi:MAG TPA: sterol desaturase family protein [Rhizomicrobium sp.]|nr:sterol desaturase family protein [Rhizomicrobium sp.]